MTPVALAAAPAVPFAAASSPSFALLARAIGQAGTVIAGIRPGQEGRPVPGGGDVQALVAHVIDDVHRFARATAGSFSSIGPGARPAAGGSLGPVADWVEAYRDAARELLAVWAEPGVPASAAAWLIGRQLTDLAAHAHTLAAATSQSTDMDTDVAAAASRWSATHRPA